MLHSQCIDDAIVIKILIASLEQVGESFFRFDESSSNPLTTSLALMIIVSEPKTERNIGI